MSEGPRVTILMPVYNGQLYVDEAIASVVGQGYADFEFVIVDDGSTDATPAILEQWAARDARIVLCRSPRNEGIPAALNRGLAVARGQYIGRQDADDLCLPGRIAAQVAVLDARPDVEIVSAGYEVIEPDGRVRYSVARYEAPEVVEYLLNFSNFIGGHGQVMFRRASAAAVGNYSVVHPNSQDYELWSKLIRRGHCVVLPMIGMQQRLHEERASIVWGSRQHIHSVAVSRNNLETLLERKLSDQEVAAVAAVWRQMGKRGMAADADRVFVETYARFVARKPLRSHRRRARMAKARIWFIGAAIHAKRGSVVEAFQYIGYSLRWHPLGFLSGVVNVAARALKYVWRKKWRQADLGDGATSRAAALQRAAARERDRARTACL